MAMEAMVEDMVADMEDMAEDMVVMEAIKELAMEATVILILMVAA